MAWKKCGLPSITLGISSPIAQNQELLFSPALRCDRHRCTCSDVQHVDALCSAGAALHIDSRVRVNRHLIAREAES